MPQEHRLKKLQIIAVRALGIYVSSFAEALTRLRQQHQNIFFTPVLLKLSNLPWSFKDRSATDRRDKIYGLLGLLGDHGVQVDYGKPSEDIYLSFSSSFLLEDKGLDLFRWVTGEDYESKNPRLPSWVPDFGHLFDVVSQCGSDYPSSDDIGLAGHEIRPILDPWKNMSVNIQSEMYRSSNTKEDAFWRTILTDRQIEGLHFKENAGWVPAQRLSVDAQYIPPKTTKEEEDLLQAMEQRQLCLDRRRRKQQQQLKMLFTKVSIVCALAAFATAADVTITSTKVNTATDTKTAVIVTSTSTSTQTSTHTSNPAPTMTAGVAVGIGAIGIAALGLL
ncbi:hypothetical protein COCSADRAFT_179294 [Bipolaris sorokiniana ND90Pr]|uniref:Uncharacterized protein n=2 Tax=Cochliobolus sativus TaxID=45130 RepID=M2TEN2_COCSN|nr:uncharacterized protein COCSADRAFT_179294 [Bipolaris sorokiniana ND90Pr]EMD67686.1 hypothetical protein COCSADRAFT_179294 [Bipolaris sorokiniana ND90Pr]